MPEKNRPNELKITRLYDAPVKLVWEAWTDPAKVEKWWGPRGFTLTTHSKELKVGGHWHYTMHGPDGTDYPNKTTYLEVEKYKRLVYDHGANDDRPALFRVTVLFTDLGDQTQMDMIMAWLTAVEAEQAKKFIKDAGGHATWDRLAEYLEKEGSDRDLFVINRSFDATADALFDMWTNPKHFSQWLGPVGIRMDFIDDDIAEGKTSFYKMTYNTGLVMHGKMTYLKIERPTYLEYRQIFCDEKGQLSKHPNAADWPERMRTRVFLSQEGTDQTRVTVVWQPDGDVSKKELQAFVDMRTGMTQGWSQAFDKLDTYLIDQK